MPDDQLQLVSRTTPLISLMTVEALSSVNFQYRSSSRNRNLFQSYQLHNACRFSRDHNRRLLSDVVSVLKRTHHASAMPRIRSRARWRNIIKYLNLNRTNYSQFCWDLCRSRQILRWIIRAVGADVIEFLYGLPLRARLVRRDNKMA